MSDVPEFGRMWQAARVQVAQRRRRRRQVLATTSAAAMILGAVLFSELPLQPTSDIEGDLRMAAELSRRIETWEGPLDSLLDAPGSAWLETTPEFGDVEIRGWLEDGASS
jgi:hypothetical protein